MTRSTPIHVLAGAALIALAALTMAACGGTGAATAAPATHAALKTTGGASTTVQVAKTGLGNTLVDSQGRTLYLFNADRGAKSSCFGACATAWPPLRAGGTPTAGTGVNRSQVGVTPRSDGKPQVTYHGHPLYLYVGDQKPGDTNGQGISGFGAPWFALTPGGTQISS